MAQDRNAPSSANIYHHTIDGCLDAAIGQCGLTQAELSEKSGVAQSTIAHIESGKHERPHPGTLRKLAEALGIETAELLED